MGIITLLTDWGTRDHFAAALKGELLTQVPGVNIVDISHHVKHHDIIVGAFILRNSWMHFPAGTVHVVGMVGHGQQKPLTIAIKYRNHYFVGCNDGFFSLALDGEMDACYYLLTAEGNAVPPSMQVLADAAAFLAGGGDIKDMGRPVEDFVVKTIFQPFVEDDSVRGAVVYIDSFGNVITNITRVLFSDVGKGRRFEIHLRAQEYTLTELSNDYREVGPGNLLVKFNDDGFLEIAIAEGDASKLLNLKYGNPIRVDFKS